MAIAQTMSIQQPEATDAPASIIQEPMPSTSNEDANQPPNVESIRDLEGNEVFPAEKLMTVLYFCGLTGLAGIIFLRTLLNLWR